MSSTVLASSGFEVSSNSEDAASMMETLQAPNKDRTPRVLVDKGQKVKPIPDEPKDETSQAASVLGKKGAQAAAEKRALEAKDKAAAEKKDAKAEAKADAEAIQAKGKAEPAEGEEVDSETVGKPRDDPKARIRQLAEQKNAEKDRADKAERELAEVKRARQAPAVETPAAPARTAQAAPKDDPKPVLANFRGEQAYEEFVEATSRWAARDERRQDREREAKDQAVEADRKEVTDTMSGFFGRLEEHAKTNETFWEKTADVARQLQPSVTLPRDEQGRIQGLTGKNVVADRVMKSDLAPALMEHFADNPDELQRISALRTPGEIALAVERLAGRLEASREERSDAAIADTSSKREVSKAGSPVRSVAGSPHTAPPDIHGPMNFDTFISRKRARNS